MVAVKSTLEKPDVEQILAYYDVGVIEDVKAFTTGTVQTNILLHTTCGRFVLRYYERHRSFNSVLWRSWRRRQKSMLIKLESNPAGSGLRNLRVDGGVAVPVARSVTTGGSSWRPTRLCTMWLFTNCVT